MNLMNFCENISVNKFQFMATNISARLKNVFDICTEFDQLANKHE